MLKSEMQHQFWVTKKTVQRKLGSKEDQCVVNVDSELDLKIELFESISSTSQDLFRILDIYQERMSCLAMEETALGRFLKEHGKLSQTSGKRMSTAGKSISYSGQQRMAVRAPLIRLHSELDTFCSRAVADTQATIRTMERDRTEYRASLSWMKSITFDPEDARGMEKFRKAQQTVRSSKERFDRKSLDCLEKIDLLAAARCNMFSHVLVAYQNAMQEFARKTNDTFKVASKILENEPNYVFTILRDLTQAEKEPKSATVEKEAKGPSIPEMSENAIDHDQLLFFQDDYTDGEEQKTNAVNATPPKEESGDVHTVAKIEPESLICVNQDKPKTDEQLPTGNVAAQRNSILDALDDGDDFFLEQGDANLLNMDFGSSAGDSLMQSSAADPLMDLLGTDIPSDTLQPPPPPPVTGKSVLSALGNKLKSSTKSAPPVDQNGNKSKQKGKDISSWYKLFSELDPLANPDAMSKQIDASNSHST